MYYAIYVTYMDQKIFQINKITHKYSTYSVQKLQQEIQKELESNGFHFNMVQIQKHNGIQSDISIHCNSNTTYTLKQLKNMFKISVNKLEEHTEKINQQKLSYETDITV